MELLFSQSCEKIYDHVIRRNVPQVRDNFLYFPEAYAWNLEPYVKNPGYLHEVKLS